MTYVDGVVTPVPTANKNTYLEHAEEAAELFRKLGALSIVECWGNDVPEGKLNSFHTAVMRKPDETVAFSWIVWPDKATRDAAWQRIMEGEGADTMKSMPFDGKRMIYGGFEVLLET
ncbi:MAG: hypothetical protein RLZ98_1811 [Pseudomonadota bacterium]|jgi:uncharacterized protein YbaA (DUF1428 family)